MEIKFSKDEVLSGLTGRAMDCLLNISDCDVLRFALRGEVSFSFEGWMDDDRSIIEIEECRTFFGQLTDSWPFWFYFLRKGGDQFGMALALLCPVAMNRVGSEVELSFINQMALNETCRRLIDGVALLLSQSSNNENIYSGEMESIAKEIGIFLT